MCDRLKRTVWLAAAAILASGSARADDAADLRAKLDQEQASLNGRLNHIDALGQVHGRYVLIRDTYLYGPAGIAKLGAAWFDKAHNWVGQWQKLLALFADATPATLSRLDVQNGIRDALKQQQMDWLSLKDDADAVYARAAEANLTLANVERLPESYVEHYEAQMRTLNGQLDGLGAALTKAAAGFAVGEHQVWDQLTAETQTAVFARLNRAMLQYPDLLAAITRVQTFFQAERALNPLVRSVQVALNQLRDDLSRQRLFHATAALATLRSAAAAALSGIDQAEIDAEFAGPAKDDVAKVLAAGEQLFDSSTRSFTHGALVAAFKTKEARRLAAQCRDQEQRKGLNCDVLRTLAPIQPAVILAMTDEQLRYLEYSFDNVTAGALR